MHRLAEGGCHLDRHRPLRFTFDGRELSGYAGDTLASALIANGIGLVARSYKLHRPRGLVGSGPEEPNGYFGIGEGAAATPNQRATEILLEDGMVVRSQNRWPSLAFDIGEVNALCSRLLPAGFYYKTFLFPRIAWKWVYEPLIRRAAGMGRAPVLPDPDVYEQLYLHTDLLVVGAGPAGLAAARAGADAGARVLLVEQTPWAGGRLLADDARIEGRDGGDWARAELAALAGRPNVTVRLSTMAAALYDHNYALLYERPEGAGAPRRRLWRVRAERVVLAAGALERPIAFANNDRPGVMLASAVRDYLRRWAAAPGSAAVIYTCNDDAYQTAFALVDAGLEVRRIVDARQASEGGRSSEARARGIPVSHGAGIVSVQGRKRVRAVEIAPVRGSGRPGEPREKIACDLVAVSGGWSPTAHLYCHAGGQLAWDEASAMHLPDPAAPPASTDGSPAVLVAGAAQGLMNLPEVLASGAEAGARAAADLGYGEGRAGPPPRTDPVAEQAPESRWLAPGGGRSAVGDRHFVDYQHDVTVADLELAVREGYGAPEHAKRYTTLGMAPDQGKLSNALGHGILAETRSGTTAKSGSTTIRPPYSGITLGAIAGTQTGSLFRAVRETAIHPWHAAHEADFEPVGDWRRPYCYRRGNETRNEAVAREITAARASVGMIDASTLGKLLVGGPDAGRFLDLVYTNRMSTLAAGRCRYGLMCNDAGYLFDDGVVARLGDGTFLCHTTSGGAERVHAWLEEWLQTEWFDLQVHVANVTEQWAQFAVIGPRSRELLQVAAAGMDLSEEALPSLALAEGRISGAPARAFGISFSGALACELAVPVGYGASLWDALLEAGREFGLTVYGTEALHVMRAEVGYIMIGDETDGTVTPLDLNLGWAVSRKKDDFLGMRGMKMPHLAAEDRRRLVGLLTEDPETVLPDGACAVEKGRIIGHVTSSYRSPTLGRSIAMALVQRGPERLGETLSFPVRDGLILRARIVKPEFLNLPGGENDG